MADRAVALGGLKAACLGCQPWIGYFSDWVRRQYKITIALPPEDDNRPHAAAQGDRPTWLSADPIADRKAEHLGAYVRALFNGGANTAFGDVVARENDDIW